MPELNEKQIKQYNAFRAEGMTPEKALALATQGDDNQYNPAIEAGVDGILFGKKSLTSAIGNGLKNAAYSGFKTVYDDTQKYGAGFALLKSPLSLVAGVGRGVGDIVGGALETADDLTGEAVSGFTMPLVEGAVNSDVGQYLMNKATEWDQKGRGVPGDILDSLNLLGWGALAKGGTASALRNTIINATKEGVGITAGTAGKVRTGLSGFLNARKVVSPGVTTIEDSLSGITKILSENLDNPSLLSSIDEIKAILKEKNPTAFFDTVKTKVDDLLKDADVIPEQKTALENYIRQIEGVLKDDNAGGIVESFLSGASSKVDNIADRSVSVIEGLSDDLIDKGLKTIDKVRSIPAAISGRAKQAIDRRIVRIAESDPVVASDNILSLYKRGIVPGVKKKNKTIANIKSIDEAVKETVPQLAKKYDVQDIEDFANVINLEKKSIFAEIEKGLVDAGNKGRAIDTKPIIDELDKLLASERAEFSTPLKNAIARARKELVDTNADGSIEIPKKMSPTGAQDIIADLNAQLQSYYRGSTAGTNADVIVDNLVVNNLRKSVDDIVDDLGEGSFKELKRKYGNLKKMEDDVVHRAVFEAQKGNGITSDMTDILSAGDIMAGAINPVFFAKGAAQFLTKEVIKSLSDKDELIRQMFLYGKSIK